MFCHVAALIVPVTQLLKRLRQILSSLVLQGVMQGGRVVYGFTSKKLREHLRPLLPKDQLGHPSVLCPHLDFIFLETCPIRPQDGQVDVHEQLLILALGQCRMARCQYVLPDLRYALSGNPCGGQLLNRCRLNGKTAVLLEEIETLRQMLERMVFALRIRVGGEQLLHQSGPIAMCPNLNPPSFP